MTAEQAFDQYHTALYRFLYRMVGRGDVAEDLTQECFLALLRDAERWDAARGTMKTFLFSIGRNLACKHFRDDHPALQVDEESAVSAVNVREHQELSLAVAQIVAQLPDLQREALILFEYEGFQLAEIAEIVHSDVGVVKSRLHRARERLKRQLAPYRKVETA